MIEIIRPQDSGKAKALLEAARKTPNSYIITKDKRTFIVKAHSYGYDDVWICDYDDLKNDTFPLGRPAFIHNGDKMLAELLQNFYGIELAGFTATTPNEGGPKPKKQAPLQKKKQSSNGKKQ